MNLKFTPLLLIFVVFIGCKTQNQLIKPTSKKDLKKYTANETALKICDSIKSISTTNKDSLDLVQEQLNIHSFFLEKSFVINAPSYNNLMNDLSVYNYKMTRELRKECSEYRINSFVLPIRTNIFDIEGLFTSNEFDSITKYAREFEKQKNIRLLIVTLDETYPYNDVTNYADGQGNDWNIGSKSENGGIMFVFSKLLKSVRISTSSKAKGFLTDDEIIKIIDEIIVPEFKKEEFYEGVIKTIREFKNKT